MIERIKKFLHKHFTPQATLGELDAELHARQGERGDDWRRSNRRAKRKTLRGAIHHHRPAAKGRSRRSYLPTIFGLRKRKFRPSCRFVYSRPSRQASAEARFRVIRNNDRIANAIEAKRIEDWRQRVAA